MITKFAPFIDSQIEKLLSSEDLEDVFAISDQDWDVSIKELIIKEVGEEIFDFVSEYATYKPNDVHIISTRTRFNIEKITKDRYRTIVNLKRVNDFRRINKYFQSVNSKLPKGGVFINKVETHAVRKNRILKKLPKPLNYIYYLGDVALTRVIPKLKWTKGLYFHITKGKGRVLTKAETFGRLYSCGFEILEERTINNELYFVARKIKEPIFDHDPTYGPLIKLNRLGEKGKTIKVYKFRTMYPFSEYLQEYVFEKNNLKEGGKIKNDFRISHEGKIMRKYWIDELPMIINLIKNEMKLIGVRPLSNHYFSLYPKELQEKRTKVKPGLLPPFYADMPKTLDEIVASETKYLDAYEKAPIKTDINYLIRIMKNILLRGKRSC
ncbi:sugar transferase [Aquimarina amphilecti]|uniref:Sugar transferase n=1 Tax=Aquimarina amphilecti TaxID=1038014 RepID=A0A1H7MIF3_AQUAM|nr:sugar transferase [Aquimarina amphilecti]SEL10688.1 sugar transferase [Aquimarina amphilecti]